MVNRFRRNEDWMDWFFRVVFPKMFMVMAVGVLIWFLFIGYVMYTFGSILINDPAQFGRTVGQMVQGFQESSGK